MTGSREGGQHAELGGGQRRRAAEADRQRGHLATELRHLRVEDPEPRVPAKDLAGLGQHRARPRRVTKGKVGPREADQADHGERRLGGELRPQDGQVREPLPRRGDVAASHGQPHVHGERGGGGRVTAEWRCGPCVDLGQDCSGLCPVAEIRGHHGAMACDAIRESNGTGGVGGRNPVRHDVVDTVQVIVGQLGDRQQPEREVAPAAARRLECHREAPVEQHLLRPSARHHHPEHRPPGLERRGAVGGRTLERPALDEIREVLRRRAFADRELLERREGGEPGAFLDLSLAEPADPGPEGRSARGPVVSDEARAQEPSRLVQVTRVEGVPDRAIEVTCRLVPGRSALVQAGHQLRFAFRQLRLQELAKDRVIPVPAAILVDQDRRVSQVAERRRGARPAVTASHSGPLSRSRMDVCVRKLTRFGSCLSSTSSRR